MIEVEINNNRKLRVSQTESDKIRGGIGLEHIDEIGNIERRDLIDEGDFVMLMNYYSYIKDNDIRDDFINRHGVNKRQDIYNDLDIEESLNM